MKNKLKNFYPSIYKELLEQNETSENFSYGSSKKVWWQCPKNDEHKYQARIADRCLKNSQCPFCCGRKICSTNNFKFTHPEIAKECLNPNDALQNTYASKNKIWWRCELNHEYEARIQDRCLKNSGCSFCNSKKISFEKSLQNKYPQIAKEWHLKNKESPKQVFAKSTKKFWWQCQNNHEWFASIVNRTQNNCGCPFCNKSKGEKVISDYLNRHNLDYTEQKRFKSCKNKKSLPFDFYIKSKNTLIEFQGVQHFKPTEFCRKSNKSIQKSELKFKETQKNDLIKENWCIENNIKLIKIAYWEKDKIQEILNHHLQPLASNSIISASH